MSSVLLWPGMRTEYAVLPVSDRVTVTGERQIGVAFSGHRGLVRAVDGRATRADAPPGVVYVTGPNRIRWLEVREPIEALEIYPDQTVLEQALSERPIGGPVETRPAYAVKDGTMFAVATLLRSVHLGQRTVTDIEASTLAHRVAHHLADRYVLGRSLPRPAGTLSWRQVDTVDDFVEAHLGARLSLDALAASVSLSPFHFARAFRATTGLAPHAYATARRLTRAKDQLLRVETTVADAAGAVGFTNVGHFRRLFYRQFGINPGHLPSRRSHRTAQDRTPDQQPELGILTW